MLTLRTKLSVLFLALLLTSGLGIGLAAPASATHDIGNTAIANSCMYYANGAAYANKLVYLTRWNGAKWVVYRSGYTAANGCIGFAAVMDYYYRFEAYSTFSGGYFYGRSNWQYHHARYWWYPVYYGDGTGYGDRFTVRKYYN